MPKPETEWNARKTLKSLRTREQFIELTRAQATEPPLSAAKGTDIEEDAPVLFALVEQLRPKVLVELGTRQGISTRIFAAAKPADSTLYTVDPVDCRRYLKGVECTHVVKAGEDFFNEFEGQADFLFIDTDPHTFEQTMGWMTTWVEKKLAPGGVAVFHDVQPAREEIRVREAVTAWLNGRRGGWKWLTFLPARALPVFNGGLGILWAPDAL
jgi:predicted O-methyltransferase YrrM